MNSQAITAYGAPLQAREGAVPEPRGSEVLLRIDHCGVCHSDLHLQDGHFDLGEGRRLELGASLPLVPGHEIEGRVVALGPDARGVAVGERRVVYPWIGCGDCPTCGRGEEHLCSRPRALGVNVDGGYSDHVRVPHARYLLDCEGIVPGLAGLYMCSGLTAYSALLKAGPPAGEPLAIVGLGGVGMMAVQFARALYPQAELIAVDVREDRLRAAAQAGAARTVDATRPDAAKQLFKATGGVAAAVDFVGSEASLAFVDRALRKGGRAVIVGLFGGRFSLPIPLLPLRAVAFIGSYVGSPAEAEAMLERVRAGGIAPIPVQHRPLSEANQALDALRAGEVLGRTVLDC